MRPKLYRYSLDPLRAAKLLRRLMPIAGDDAPLTVTGWRDSSKRIRRVRAIYPNGWCVRVSFDAGGNVTARSAALKMTAELRAE